MDDHAARIVSITPTLIKWLDEYELDDLVGYFDPDALFVVNDADTDLDFHDIRSRFDPVCFYPEAENKRIRHVPLNGIDFIVIDGVDTLDVAKQIEEMGAIDDSECVYLVTTDLDIKLDTTDLTAALVNQDQYKRHTGETDGKYVYVTGSLPSHYRQEWGDMIVQGGRPKEVRGGLAIPQLTCYPDGRVGVDTIRSSRLGLRALEGVGRKTAQKLEENGYQTREEVARATRGDLKDIYGIGQKTANRLWYHSRALERREVKRRNNNPVPGSDNLPVFISIETDGMTPSVIWHIGIFNSETGSYKSFLAKTPEEKDDIIRSFASWYATEARGKTVISWKGWESDFHHLNRFVSECAPEYESIWRTANECDLYYWAVEQNNAVLPGRTEDITEICRALGYDLPQTGLSSRQVMREYRQWMGGEVSEPDWKLIDRYCWTKVEALVRVYDELSLGENVHGYSG